MNTLKQFRTIAILEGVSYLLLALTMPLKYLYDMPLPNKIVGMGHGILFIAFIFWLYLNMVERKWKFSKVFILFISSLLPFGTFVADKKILSKEI
ncbi:MAG: DUF3817 domain-containing protein [Bacteroidetes bacterium]|nr:DUF3817 domain-containing protein [Bacteroidota bacterium]